MYSDYYLERKINRLYQQNKIMFAHDLSIERISSTLGIMIYYSPTPSFSYKLFGSKCIAIDSRLNNFEQREIFFHEICHALFHTGDQRSLPASFNDYQEYQANSFILFASMPYYMIRQYNLSSPYIVDELSESFLMNRDLVKRRLEQIHNRILASC